MSAVGELRAAVLAGQSDVLAPSATAQAVIELADRVAALEARVFPPQPQPADAVVIASQAISTERPQLSGTYEEPEPTPAPAPAPEA